jgi:hypothetical protein
MLVQKIELQSFRKNKASRKRIIDSYIKKHKALFDQISLAGKLENM